MNIFRRNIILYCGILLLSINNCFGQFCEDSIQSYGLYASFPLNQGFFGSLKISNGSNANINIRYLPVGSQASIVLTDANGQLLQAKTITATQAGHELILENLIEAPQNGIIALGRLLTTGGYEKGLVVLKFDNSLAVEWCKLVKRTTDISTFTEYHHWGIHCDAGGDVYLSAFARDIMAPSFMDVHFIKLDPAGNVVWSKGIESRQIPGTFFCNAVTTIDDKVIFTGNFQRSNANVGFIGFSFNRQNANFNRSNWAVVPGSASLQPAGINYRNVQLFPRQKDFYYVWGEKKGQTGILSGC